MKVHELSIDQLEKALKGGSIIIKLFRVNGARQEFIEELQNQQAHINGELVRRLTEIREQQGEPEPPAQAANMRVLRMRGRT